MNVCSLPDTQNLTRRELLPNAKVSKPERMEIFLGHIFRMKYGVSFVFLADETQSFRTRGSGAEPGHVQVWGHGVA